jgi:hypothetical protein
VGSLSSAGKVGGGKRFRLEFGLVKMIRKTAATPRVASRVSTVSTLKKMEEQLLEDEAGSRKSKSSMRFLSVS